ncbi:hypothetical protein GZH46_02946, partial [Fragariocoptes setiger]
GCRIKIDDAGNILIKRRSRANVFICGLGPGNDQHSALGDFEPINGVGSVNKANSNNNNINNGIDIGKKATASQGSSASSGSSDSYVGVTNSNVSSSDANDTFYGIVSGNTNQHSPIGRGGNNNNISNGNGTGNNSGMRRSCLRALNLDEPVKLFDMKAFQKSLAHELRRPSYINRRRLKNECISIVSFVVDDRKLLNLPSWVMIINIVALDLLRSKLGFYSDELSGGCGGSDDLFISNARLLSSVTHIEEEEDDDDNFSLASSPQLHSPTNCCKSHEHSRSRPQSNSTDNANACATASSAANSNECLECCRHAASDANINVNHKQDHARRNVVNNDNDDLGYHDLYLHDRQQQSSTECTNEITAGKTRSVASPPQQQQHSVAAAKKAFAHAAAIGAYNTRAIHHDLALINHKHDLQSAALSSGFESHASTSTTPSSSSSSLEAKNVEAAAAPMTSVSDNALDADKASTSASCDSCHNCPDCQQTTSAPTLEACASFESDHMIDARTGAEQRCGIECSMQNNQIDIGDANDMVLRGQRPPKLPLRYSGPRPLLSASSNVPPRTNDAHMNRRIAAAAVSSSSSEFSVAQHNMAAIMNNHNQQRRLPPGIPAHAQLAPPATQRQVLRYLQGHADVPVIVAGNDLMAARAARVTCLQRPLPILPGSALVTRGGPGSKAASNTPEENLYYCGFQARVPQTRTTDSANNNGANSGANIVTSTGEHNKRAGYLDQFIVGKGTPYRSRKAYAAPAPPAMTNYSANNYKQHAYGGYGPNGSGASNNTRLHRDPNNAMFLSADNLHRLKASTTNMISSVPWATTHDSASTHGISSSSASICLLNSGVVQTTSNHGVNQSEDKQQQQQQPSSSKKKRSRIRLFSLTSSSSSSSSSKFNEKCKTNKDKDKNDKENNDFNNQKRSKARKS